MDAAFGGAPLADSSVCDRVQVAGGGLPFSANGRPMTSGMRSSAQPAIKRQKLNPADAPNPVVFVATKDTRYWGRDSCARQCGVSGKGAGWEDTVSLSLLWHRVDT